jgi:hypothetical protein
MKWDCISYYEHTSRNLLMTEFTNFTFSVLFWQVLVANLTEPRNESKCIEDDNF